MTLDAAGPGAPAPEAPLLPRVAAGEPDAVRACLERHGPLVWSLALRRAPNRAEAEDAVQEIFLELWKTADRYDPTMASESTFVATLARRRLIDRWRRRQRRPDFEALPEAGSAPASEPAGDDHHRLEHRAEIAMARKALAELDPDRRRVLELSVVQGLTHREIAERTQLRLGTVKSHIRRGLIALRQSLLLDPADPVAAPDAVRSTR